MAIDDAPKKKKKNELRENEREDRNRSTDKQTNETFSVVLGEREREKISLPSTKYSFVEKKKKKDFNCFVCVAFLFTICLRDR